MPAEIIAGDLLKSKSKYITHQCNCCSLNSAGVAKTIFNVYPYADIYSIRQKTHWRDVEDKPGSIIICGDGICKRYIVNILGQYFPGKPKFASSKLDGYAARQIYFKSCLSEVADIDNLESISFPWKIGCGIAGGDWVVYRQMIDDFADALPNVEVKIIKYKELIDRQNKRE